MKVYKRRTMYDAEQWTGKNYPAISKLLKDKPVLMNPSTNALTFTDKHDMPISVQIDQYIVFADKQYYVMDEDDFLTAYEPVGV